MADPRALADATHIHARESVPLAWAMPLEGRREEAGRFWAFFPTHTQTYLPGILNAPWKLNSDRNAIIGGEWNDFLMAEAAALIAESLPGLATPEDPGRPLDAFPRQMDRRDENAATLVDELWVKLGTLAVIPDASGAMRCARELWRHPKDSPQLAGSWQALAPDGVRLQFVHPSCLERQRPSRLNALAERVDAPSTGSAPPALRRCSTELWFACVASVDTITARGVLDLAQSFSTDVKPGEWNQVRSSLAIIPTQTGELVTASKVVLTPEGVPVPGRASVAAELHSDVQARRILAEVLHVDELDDEVWESVLVEALQVPRWPAEAAATDWRSFWSRLRLAPPAVRKSFLETHGDQIRVRRRDGQWAKADSVLLAGALVPEDSPPPNANTLVDPDTHGNDRASLHALRVEDVPTGDVGPASFHQVSGGGYLLTPWRDACRSLYKRTHDNSASWGYLESGWLAMPRGYRLLAELASGPKARFTLQLIERLDEPAFRGPIRFGHSTMTVYPKIHVPHPLPWFLLTHGEVPMGAETTAPLRALVARRDEAALSRLPSWERIAAVLDRLQSAFPEVRVDGDDLYALWDAAIDTLVTAEALEEDSLTDLWLGAGKDGVLPTDLPSPVGRLPLTEVFVTTSADLARRARTPARIIVALDTPTMELWQSAGAQDLAALVHAEWESLAGPPERLTDVVPELADALRAEVRESARCQRVTQLRFRVGDSSQATPCLMWDGSLHLDAVQLASLSRSEGLRCQLNELAPAGWLEVSPEEALQRLGDAQVDERRSYVAQGATLADRLLRAVGHRVPPLREALGEPLGELDFVGECAPQPLAELVLAQLGPTTLTKLRAALQDEGLQPPSRWNTAAALSFVASIGFPVEFASSSEARREAEEFVTGPIDLPPLHDFQGEVFDGLESLLASGTKRRRAVVSLPTGGGKTRVMVEAAVRLVLAPPGADRSVVWIAQTDELCEQAVQAFRQVWVNLGAKSTDLRIVRLWGGNPNPFGQELDKPVVVVASIQTLNNRFGNAGLEWLRKPGLVVVDECHHAITASYSALLRWLDADNPHAGTTERDEPPIVGLSATPFRTDDDESRRLARRFDGRWLPDNQEQLYHRLRMQGVLAQPCYESFESGVELTREELERLERLSEPWEGLDFENLLEAINQRLAGNTRRNERLVECIQASREHAILFFANSVGHANEMAARMNLAGISSASISGSTPTVARRYFLDRFQRGQVRVLCNHSVLTTGFDAPKTDMILIARQVFSPVRYMQMVGRGLRGEKNGGTEACRIVTVMDNLGRFQDRHPYHYCRDLYANGVQQH